MIKYICYTFKNYYIDINAQLKHEYSFAINWTIIYRDFLASSSLPENTFEVYISAFNLYILVTFWLFTSQKMIKYIVTHLNDINAQLKHKYSCNQLDNNIQGFFVLSSLPENTSK